MVAKESNEHACRSKNFCRAIALGTANIYLLTAGVGLKSRTSQPFANFISNRNSMKSKTTAILLAFFLGGFGAHQFYLGRKALGILYLVFFWTLIPGFIAFIDFIMLIVMRDDEFDKKYNQKA